MATLRPLMGAFVAYVKATFGSQPEILADFGIHPKARVALTVEQTAAAAAKRASTRAARGTKGSKQKLAVKGDVTGVIVTPVTHPASATPPAAPAGPAPVATALAATPK